MIDERELLATLEKWAKKSKEIVGLKEPELLRKVMEEIRNMVTIRENQEWKADKGKYRHYKTHDREIIEFDVMEGEEYITTCVVDIPAFRSGKNTFPCGNGDYVSLSIKQRLEIENLTQTDTKDEEPMMILTQKNGTDIKINLNDIKTILYEVADNLFSGAYLEACDISPSEVMMVIYMKNEAPIYLVARNWVVDHGCEAKENQSEEQGCFDDCANF